MFRKALLALAGLAACSPAPAPARAQVTPRSDVLVAAFEGNYLAEATDNKRYSVRVVRVGEVAILSGRVTLSDALFLSPKVVPLTISVPSGRYPVELAVADTGTSGHRVALARLMLSPAPPVRWSMAVPMGEDPSTLTGDEVLGYGVDTGTGAFMDAALPAWLEAKYPSGGIDAAEALTPEWVTRGEAQANELGVPHGLVLIETFEPGGIAMFSSGWGDGFYTSWIGYAADGQPAVIVTDFGVIAAVNISSAG